MGSKFEINISNFQSIGQAKLEFEPGINLLVGQSNSGKTAILRAIKSVLTNPSRAKTFIKHNKDKACVEITFENNDISWARSAKSSSYIINDELYEKLGNSDLFNLLVDNGFIKDDDDNIMNIEGEWDLPFPFDRTPSQLFKLFENIFCVSDSATIIKTYKDDEMRLVKEKADNETALNRVNEKLNALNLLTTDIDVSKVKKDLDKFKKDYQTYGEMVDDINTLAKCESVSSFKVDEKAPPTKISLNDYVELMGDIQFLMQVVARGKFGKTLPEPPVLTDAANKYSVMRGSLEDIEKAAALDKLKLDKEFNLSNEAMEAYMELQSDLNDIEMCLAMSKFDVGKDYRISNILDEYLEMQSDIKDILHCFNECKSKKNKYNELSEKISDLQARKADFKVCPLCGHPLGEEL